MTDTITISKRGETWIASFPFSYATKDVVKAAGFRFDAHAKVWYTRDAAIAAKLDPAARNAAVEASRAIDAAIDVPAPAGLAYRPFQRAGIAYAMARRDTLIGDEMGLGKTIQAIGVINSDDTIKRVLVIAKASIKINWRRELEKWLVRPMTVAIADGKTFPVDADIVVINYDIVVRHRQAIDLIAWDLLCVDECHYLKNPLAQRTKAVLGQKRGNAHPSNLSSSNAGIRETSERAATARFADRPIAARRRLFMSGTPMVNRPVELWPLVQAIDPRGLGANFFFFAREYCNAHQVKAYAGKLVWDFSGASNMEKLQRIMRERFMVRRLKSEVLRELPAKQRQILVVPAIDKALRDLLTAEIAAYDSLEEANRAGGMTERNAAFEVMSQLRHDTAMAKVEIVVEHARDTLDEAAKLVIFAHHRDVIAALAEALAEYGVVTLTGEDSLPHRQGAVDRFQADPGYRVFVGSIQAAGVGLTLTAAQTAIFAELDWVPGNVTQAEDRLHRIGQEGSVLIQHVVLDDSLDARMARMIVEKQAVLNAGLDNSLEPAAGRLAASGGEPLPVPPPVNPQDHPQGPPANPPATDELPAAQVEAIHQGIRMLAGRCDGATALDGQGFSKIDAIFGHSLARQSRLSQKQAKAGIRLVRLYQRQLPVELLRAAGVVPKGEK